MAVCYQTSLILAVRNRRYRFAQSGTHNPNLEVPFLGARVCAIFMVFASVPVASEAGITISIPASNKPKQFDNVLFYVGIPNMSEYLTLFFPNTAPNLSSMGPHTSS
jgi:hypothetical protein